MDDICYLSQKEYKSNRFFLTIYFIMLLLPGRGIFYYIRPTFCFLYWILSTRRFGYGYMLNRKFTVFFAIWFYCLVLGQLVIVGTTHSSALTHEFLRVGMYFVTMLPMQHLKLDKKWLVFLSSAFVIFNLVIQVCEFFKVEAVFTFIQSNYLVSNDLRHLNLARADSLVSFRSGSIFINPNVYTPLALMCIAVIIFALEENIENNKSGNTLLIAMLIASAFSLLLTGSRTGFLGLAVLVFIFSLKVLNKKPLLIVLIGIVFIAAFIYLSKSGSRFTSVSDGMDDSFGEKIHEIIRYISEVNPISFICGNNSNIGSPEWGYDFEWGYVLVYTGLVGIYNYLTIHKTYLMKYRLHSNGRLYLYLLLVLLVQTLSATVLYNSYAYPLLALFVFSEGVVDE